MGLSSSVTLSPLTLDMLTPIFNHVILLPLSQDSLCASLLGPEALEETAPAPNQSPLCSTLPPFLAPLATPSSSVTPDVTLPHVTTLLPP